MYKRRKLRLHVVTVHHHGWDQAILEGVKRPWSEIPRGFRVGSFYPSTSVIVFFKNVFPFFSNALFRLVWFVCISVCIFFANFIIYLNWENWRNSPTVVASIYPDVVRVRLLQNFDPELNLCRLCSVF